MGPLRGTAKKSSSFFFINSNPVGFYRQKLWGLLFLEALVTWAEGPGVGLGPLAPEISLPNFYPPHVCGGHAHSMSLRHCVSYPSGLIWFL